jgi:MSHA biogenesis protein MshG
MPIYAYKGRDTTGKAVSGTRDAENENALGIQLLKDGITPIQITTQSERRDYFHQFKDWLERSRITGDELSMFVRQMYVLTRTGVPITSGVRQLSANTRSHYMKNVLQGLAAHLESGQDLAVSMQYYPDVFNPLMISMIRVGQNSGHLDDAFLQLNQYLDLEGGTAKRIKSAVRYPIFVMIAIVLAVIIVDIFVIPTFAKMFARANIELPLLTTILINISNFLINNWIMLSVGLIAIVFSTYKYFKTPKGRLKWDEYILKLPIIGNILRRIILLRFAQTFTITTNAGIPIVEGLSLVEQAIDNTYAQQEIHAMRDALQRGTSLTKAAYNCHFFTPLEFQMLAVSEETGELGPMLEHIAKFYQREVEYDLKKLSDIIEPVLIVGLSIMVLMLAFAVYLPIWNMVKLAH